MSKQYVVGLDIGGTKCSVLLANVNNGIEILDKIRFFTKKTTWTRSLLSQ